MPDSSESEVTFLDAIINRYVQDNDVEAALVAAEQHVFNMVKEMGTGIPPEIMLEALELWISWSLRVMAGTMASIVTAVLPSWSDEQGETLAQQMTSVFALLKEDALRSIIDMKMPPDDTP